MTMLSYLIFVVFALCSFHCTHHRLQSRVDSNDVSASDSLAIVQRILRHTTVSRYIESMKSSLKDSVDFVAPDYDNLWAYEFSIAGISKQFRSSYSNQRKRRSFTLRKIKFIGNTAAMAVMSCDGVAIECEGYYQKVNNEWVVYSEDRVQY